MAKCNYDLINLDIEKLCEDHTVQELLEVEKALDSEIESKRSELRKVVGDRYKDILTASDVIRDMKITAEEIVNSIIKITEKCETLLSQEVIGLDRSKRPIDSKKIEERAILIQIRLSMILNNQIWMSLENSNYCLAAQLCLLSQHMHTGLKLLKEDVLYRLPIIKRLKSDIDVLRERILKKVKEKLQAAEIKSEEASSFLVALVLLENQDVAQLLANFLEFRKSALKTVINNCYDTIRAQVIAMVRCLFASILIIYDSFIGNKTNEFGLLWQKLEEIVSENSAPTLSKIELPPTHLVAYIPEIIRNFRPKGSKLSKQNFSKDSLRNAVKKWLLDSNEMVSNGLDKPLGLLVNIKSLHFIREEVLKIKLPDNWNDVCLEMNLPEDFNVWIYFFHRLITNRAEKIITKNIFAITNELQDEALSVLNKKEDAKNNLRLKIWDEDDYNTDFEIETQTTLSMKIKGYSSNITELCRKFDAKYWSFLQEIALYLYGIEIHDYHNFQTEISAKRSSFEKRFVDRELLEQHLKKQCSANLQRLLQYLDQYLSLEGSLPNEDQQSKLLTCARLLQAIVSLCPNLRNCCSCDGNTFFWDHICLEFSQKNLKLWQLWVEMATAQLAGRIKSSLGVSDVCRMLQVLPKWETIEIQEQGEEAIIKSQIRVPSRPSIVLEKIFHQISETLNEVLPYTLPKQAHTLYLEKNTSSILHEYECLANEDLNQMQALQFLFDVKYLTTFCIPRENVQLLGLSQQICDKLRSRVDPFDLDVLYTHLQNNVKYSVLQAQVIFGCLLPNASHLANIGTAEKRDHEKEPSVIAFSVPTNNTWFPLLPVTAPSQKVLASGSQLQKTKNTPKTNKVVDKRSSGDAAGMVRSGAAALFGAMANEWFS